MSLMKKKITILILGAFFTVGCGLLVPKAMSSTIINKYAYPLYFNYDPTKKKCVYKIPKNGTPVKIPSKNENGGFGKTSDQDENFIGSINYDERTYPFIKIDCIGSYSLHLEVQYKGKTIPSSFGIWEWTLPQDPYITITLDPKLSLASSNLAGYRI